RWEIGPDQRDDPMFKFGAGMAFREKVSDLLQLERAFDRNRKIELPAEEQHSVNVGVFLGDRFDLVAQFQNLLDLTGQRIERVNYPASFRSRKLTHPSEKQPDQGQNHQL